MVVQKITNQSAGERSADRRDPLSLDLPDCRRPLLRLTVLLTCLLIGLLPGQPVQARLPAAENVEFVSQFGGRVQAVFAQGNYVYINQAGRLAILDVAAPAAPTPVGRTLPWGDHIEDIYVSGDRAYVAAGDEGLRIIDVGDPTGPTELGFFDTPGEASGVYVSGSQAYVADGSKGLRVINVSDPANPLETGFFDPPGMAEDVYVSGSQAYVADRAKGLRVINVSDPANPTETNLVDIPGQAQAVHVSGDRAYVAAWTGGLRVIDVSDPANPTEIGSIDPPGGAGAVYVSGDRAYVTALTGGLQIIDVNDPAGPTEIGFLDAAWYADDVYVGGDRAYVAVWFGGLRVIDVSDPPNPAELGFFNTLRHTFDVHVSGDHTYVADGENGLWVIDGSDPAAPQIGLVDSGEEAWAVYVSDDLVYTAAGAGGLRLIDVSNPAAPTTIGFFDTTARNVYVNDALAYVMTGFEGLRIIDVGDPANPAELGFFDPAGEVYGVYVSDALAYVADWDGLRVLDVSDPTDPTQRGFFDTPEAAFDLYVSDELAYVATGDGLRIIDVSEPTNPTQLGYFDIPAGAEEVYLRSDRVYVAAGEDGLRVIDISDPTDPTELGFFVTPGAAVAVHAGGNLVYVADWDGGLLVLRDTIPLPPPTGPGQISGRVTAARSGEPLAGILARADRFDEGEWRPAGSALTDAAGTYTIPALAAGSYRVSFSDPAKQYLTRYYDAARDSDQALTVLVAAGETTPNIDAVLEKPGQISGRVTAAESGKPLEAILVQVDRLDGGEWQPAGSALTGPAGTYTIPALVRGSYRVFFSDPAKQYLTRYYDAARDSDQALTVPVAAGETTPNIDAVLEKPGQISGRVTAAESGKPLEAILVQVDRLDGGEWRPAGSALTGPAGTYTIPDLVRGSYRVSFSDPAEIYSLEYYPDSGDSDQAAAVSVAAGKITANIDAALEKSGPISHFIYLPLLTNPGTRLTK